MSRVVVLNSVSLDGVMQSPGRPDEDTRGGFKLGGWAVPYGDDFVQNAMGEHFARSRGLLLGRRSYEDILGHWNSVGDNPFVEALNSMHKYVASRTLTEPLRWPNSTLLPGDAADAVADLRKEDGGELLIMGSGVLIQALMARGLIDGFMLSIAPIVLGSGHRIFEDVGPKTLRLVDAKTSPKGVVVATYEVG